MKDDYEYFLRLDLSCLILDNFTQDKEFLSSVSFLNDSNEAFNQVAELDPQMIITCWRFKHVPTRLPLLYLRFLHDLYQDSRLSRLISDTLPGNRKALLATLSSYFSSLEFTQAILDSQILSISTLFQPLDDCSLSYEVCILCPYTETQIHCLRALQARWNFVFQSDMQNTILSDVALSVFHELFRLLAHPFLSGASERTICDAASLSWEDCFYRSSTKLAFVCSLIKESSHRSVLFIFSRILILCSYLQRYFESKHFATECLFGVRTLQECNAAIGRIESYSSDTPCIVILGQLPSGIHLSLQNIKEIVLFNSDIDPSLDVSYLESVFNLSRKTRLLRLITPCSLEMELFLPEKHITKDFNSFTIRETRRLISTIQLALSNIDTCYSKFYNSEYNFVTTGYVTPFFLDRNTHTFSERSMSIIQEFTSTTYVSVHRNITSKFQKLLVKVWNVPPTGFPLLFDRIKKQLPLCITENNSCLNCLDLPVLERCSILDLIICHFLNRLLEGVDEEALVSSKVIRKRRSKSQDTTFQKSIEIFTLCKEYLYRIRVAMRLNNYWVIVPYQDLYRSC